MRTIKDGNTVKVLDEICEDDVRELMHLITVDINIIDLVNCTYICSGGLGVLVWFHKKQDIKFKINPFIWEQFEMMSFDKLLNIEYEKPYNNFFE